MICSRLWISLAPRTGDIALAILVGAKIRSSFLHALGNAEFLRIKAVAWSLRVERDRSVVLKLRVVVGAIPVRNPLPNISRHVIEAEIVGRKGCDWRYAGIAIFRSILVGKMSLKRIGHPFTVWIELIAPGIILPVAATTSGELPLGLSGKALACPFCIGHGIGPRNLNDGIFFLPAKIAIRAIGMAPIRALHKPPSRQRIVERYRIGRRREYDGAGS